jgi:membrane-associated phospholipid phosphatase
MDLRLYGTGDPGPGPFGPERRSPTEGDARTSPPPTPNLAGMGSLSSSGGGSRGPSATTPGAVAAELGLGLLLLGAAALAGLAFVHRPWPNRLDVLGFGLLPADPGSHWANQAVVLGSLGALVVGVGAVFVVGVLRDWVRAVACALAPAIAVLIVQDLAKPLVGRHLGLTGASSYPSGTVAAVAALAMAATLVVPPLLRPLVGVAGVTAIAAVAVAVVVLRWHYPTDALGGIAVGMGSVLLLDGVFHLPWAVADLVHPARSRRALDLRPSPGLV